MNYLFLDIETIPAGEPDYENLLTEEQFLEQAPKSYAKAKQQEWASDKFNNQIKERDEEFRKGSLDSLKGRLFCIGLAYNDNPVDCIRFNQSERIILDEFTAWIDKNIGSREIYTTQFIGHRIGAFDNRWIAHRAFKYQNKDLLSYLPTTKFDKRLVDTNDLFNLGVYGQYTKLDDIAKFFGLEGKTEGMDGGQVYNYYLNNDYETIYKYCKNDVAVTRQIHKMMTI